MKTKIKHLCNVIVNFGNNLNSEWIKSLDRKQKLSIISNTFVKQNINHIIYCVIIKYNYHGKLVKQWNTNIQIVKRTKTTFKIYCLDISFRLICICINDSTSANNLSLKEILRFIKCSMYYV